MENNMMTGVCSNPWCKATFQFPESEIVVNGENRQGPSQCHKCRSFDSELSGGITWNTREYEGSRFDGMPHQIKYRVTNFR
jgi:hypothetical protein